MKGYTGDMVEPKKSETNGLAIASLILGILSLTGFSIFTGIPAIITGAIGLKNPTNRGLSIAGIVTGAISTVLAILVVMFFFVLLLAGVFAASSYEDSEEPYLDETPNSQIRQQI